MIEVDDPSSSGDAGVEMLEGERWQSFAQRWDACVGDGHLALTHRFLDCARHLQMDGFRMTPLALLDATGAAIGVASCFHSRADAVDLGGPRLGRVVTAIRRLLPGFLRYEVIEIGVPAIVGFPACTPDTRAFEAIIAAAMQRASRMRNAVVVVRDIDPVLASRSEAVLRRLGFKPLPLPVTMLVSLPEGSFETYVSLMRAKYRNLMKKRLSQSASISCEIVQDFAPLVPELMALWRNLYDRADRYHRIRVTPAFFTAVSALEESRVLVLRRQDASIAAFAVLYLDGQVVRATIGGFTKEAALDEGAYFRMLYEIVRFAADHGFRAVSLGQTAAGPKMSIGAVPVPLSAWIWRSSRLGRGILSQLVNTLMRPEAPPPDRNVFRQAPLRPRDTALTDGAVTAGEES